MIDFLWNALGVALVLAAGVGISMAGIAAVVIIVEALSDD